MSFWTKSTNVFGGNQGSDGSVEYMNSRSLKFYIMDWNTKRAVSFKPFIESISYSFDYELGSPIVESLYADAETKQVKGIQAKYSFVLNLVSHSLSEAKVNLSKINELIKFKSVTKAETDQSGPFDFYTSNTFGIYFSNLISNGRATGAVDVTIKDFSKNAVWGYIESFSFDKSSELGFFEENERIYPKIIQLSFEFIVSFRATKEILKRDCGVTDRNDIFLPFNSSGGYFSSDVKSWPFGIKESESSIGKDGKYVYGNNKKTYVTISNKNCGNKSVNFLMFMDSLKTTFESKSEDHPSIYPLSLAKIKGGNNYKFDISFSVPAHSIGEAKNNLFLFQDLLRIVNNFNDLIEESTVSENKQSDKFVLPTDVQLKNLVKAEFTLEYGIQWNKAEEPKRQEFLKRFYDDESGINFTLNTSIPENLVMVSNLINRGDSTLPSTHLESGVPCIIEGIKFDPEIDMGFFEENKMLYFKSYKISMNCVAVETDEFEISPAYTTAKTLDSNDGTLGPSKQIEGYESIILSDNFNVIAKLGD